ncbi:branched-chain amino acid ABC transporter permease [Lacisediminimonas profundi]|uniref:branched-chain amino acid ABC transporter permease n=1 Tax=Lacisediminimonas profundi TaxID=2603856 RepID=UPI00124AEE41|nr:branched-chain amino acid ABC transporter permease [Lacisediminimonas profundi]
MFPQLLVQGIATGAVYALVGLGFTMVFRTLNQVIFSQGHVFMAGSFLGFAIVSKFPVGPVTAILMVAVAGFIFGIILDRLAFRKLYSANHMNFVIATIGLGIVLQNGIRIFYPEPVKYPALFGTKVYEFSGIRIAEPFFWVVGVALIAVTLLHLFFTYSRHGRALRAVASDRVVASAMGINVNLAIMMIFAISTSVAAIGGLLIGPLYYASFDMGDMVGLKAFSAAIIGGINSVPGTIVGGIIIGVLENLSAGYISSAYKDAVVFAVLIIMLLVRPHGLFGRAIPTKV